MIEGAIRKPREQDIRYTSSGYVLNWVERDYRGDIKPFTKTFKTYIEAILKIAEINRGKA
tara:strand:- start:45 stop:224 length:180 start_codon:yes stop_codon:yes gene_type:complete